MTSSSKKILYIFKIKFPTKRIFRIFPILRINGMAPFCNLFIERPSYDHCCPGGKEFWKSVNICRSYGQVSYYCLLTGCIARLATNCGNGETWMIINRLPFTCLFHYTSPSRISNIRIDDGRPDLPSDFRRLSASILLRSCVINSHDLMMRDTKRIGSQMRRNE